MIMKGFLKKLLYVWYGHLTVFFFSIPHNIAKQLQDGSLSKEKTTTKENLMIYHCLSENSLIHSVSAPHKLAIPKFNRILCWCGTLVHLT